MIRLGLHILKLTIFSVVVLVLGQIQVRGQRICDYVQLAVKHGLVQRPVHWIGDNFNFLEGHKAVHALTEKIPQTRANDPEHSESDRSRLSGLLKTR